MRKAIWAGGIVAALVLLAFLAAVLFVDVNRFRGPIQSQLEKGLGRQVLLGAIRLQFFPLAITVGDCSIGESPRFATGRPFAKAREMRVRIGLLPLLRKQVQVDSLVLAQPAIELVRNRQGEWNFSSLGREGAGKEGGGGFTLGRLQIEDGSLAVTDLSDRGSRSVYDHIDVDLRDFAPGKAFRLTAAAQLPGSGRDALKIEGEGGPAGGARVPFTGRVTLDKASITGLMRFSGSGAAPQFDGLATGTADVDARGPAVKVKGGFGVTGASLRKASLGYPVRLDFQLAADRDSGLVTVPAANLKIGNVPVSLSGQADTRAGALRGGLKLARANLAEVLALARAAGAADVNGSGTVSLDARIQGSYDKPGALLYEGSGSLENAALRVAALTKPVEIRTASLAFDKNGATLANVVSSLGSSTLRGKLTARNAGDPDIAFDFAIDKLDVAELQQLSAGGGKGGSGGGTARSLSAKGSVDVGTILFGGIVLSRVHADAALSKGVLVLAPLTSELFGGKEIGSITVDMRPQPATVAMKTKLEAVDAQKLLAAATSVKEAIHGLLAADMDTQLALAPGAEMARTINGRVSLQLSNGRIAGVNILNQLAGVAKFLGFRQNPQAYTDVAQLAGDLNVTNGVAATNNLRLQIEGGTVTGEGTANLATQALDLRVTAVLDKSMSQKVGGTAIGGFLSTALANSKGELVIPAFVTGTFAQPRFAPDAGRVAEMKLKNLLPTSSGSATGALTDLLKAPGAAKTPDAVQDVLGAIDALRGAGGKSQKKP